MSEVIDPWTGSSSERDPWADSPKSEKQTRLDILNDLQKEHPDEPRDWTVLDDIAGKDEPGTDLKDPWPDDPVPPPLPYDPSDLRNPWQRTTPEPGEDDASDTGNVASTTRGRPSPGLPAWSEGPTGEIPGWAQADHPLPSSQTQPDPDPWGDANAVPGWAQASHPLPSDGTPSPGGDGWGAPNPDAWIPGWARADHGIPGDGTPSPGGDAWGDPSWDAPAGATSPHPLPGDGGPGLGETSDDDGSGPAPDNSRGGGDNLGSNVTYGGSSPGRFEAGPGGGDHEGSQTKPLGGLSGGNPDQTAGHWGDHW